jgi:Cu/Ag efflux protein CusF
MRVSKVVILVNLALGVGLLIGYQWGAREARQAAPALTAPGSPQGRQWTVKGIVRGTLPEQGMVVITHEPIPGLMGAMTMGFRVEPGRSLDGLQAGEVVELELDGRGAELRVVALRKQGR